jgi:hypothetical protein
MFKTAHLGKPSICSEFEKSMKPAGDMIKGYLAPGGDNHNSVADKVSKELTGKDVMGNVGNLDPNRAKPNSMNPGFDKGFWAKASPQKDTTGHGTLTKPIKD